ncbi:glucokinase [Desulfohalotomaculum tongense]|uniref:ROK family protein n=1 Tax=Desulforadius tongensis TaxID=1216062 RepID=UPI0019562BE0|nr:ROK family protein [Desulforadius tongensis]MBM7853648.1 glucokinase [Desulforadius tongensis]
MTNYVIGVDLGGTKIFTVLADMHGSICAEIKVPTGAAAGPEKVMERLVNSAAAVRQQCAADPRGLLTVAVGVPGPELDAERGLVYFSNNLGWYDIPLKEILQNELQVPVYVENDANAAALGEHVYGAGSGIDDMVYITVSTGIGGGIIIDRKIYRGVSHGAGEIGHMTIMPDGPQCTCGNTGCLESLASGTAIARAAVELIEQGRGKGILQAAGGRVEDVDARAVAGAAQRGDGEAKMIMSGAARALGIGIANIVNIINPPLVVLGGGVMESRELIWPEMERELRERAFKVPLQNLQLVPAALGSKAGALGAVALALQAVKGEM